MPRKMDMKVTMGRDFYKEGLETVLSAPIIAITRSLRACSRLPTRLARLASLNCGQALSVRTVVASWNKLELLQLS